MTPARWAAALAAFFVLIGPALADPSVEGGEGTPPAATVNAPPMGQIPGPIADVARSVANRPLSERILAISKALIGTPYVKDPLGEGAGIDADPLARYDAFDCLTFVEEVLALAFAGDPAHSGEWRNRVRYGDQAPSYGARRHFMELQWLPGAVADGLLVETTGQFEGAVDVTQEVSPGTWKAWKRRSLFALTDDQLPTGTMAMKVLPLELADAIVGQIKPGSLVLSVREARSWIPIWTTHLGFAVGGDTPMVRHASRMKRTMRVYDHSLAWYLRSLRDEKYALWKYVGISIFEPVEQGPRRIVATPPGPVGTGPADPGPPVKP